MRKTIVGGIAVVAFALSAASAGTAQAATGPSNQCYGAMTSDFATSWPWPQGQTAFPPPPGDLALLLQLFGPQLGVSTVRELQLLVCSQ
jgi:hypothetical protein